MTHREHRYRTEAGFLRAMSRFAERVICWWGEDHCWVILAREDR